MASTSHSHMPGTSWHSTGTHYSWDNFVKIHSSHRRLFTHCEDRVSQKRDHSVWIQGILEPQRQSLSLPFSLTSRYRNLCGWSQNTCKVRQSGQRDSRRAQEWKPCSFTLFGHMCAVISGNPDSDPACGMIASGATIHETKARLANYKYAVIC